MPWFRNRNDDDGDSETIGNLRIKNTSGGSYTAYVADVRGCKMAKYTKDETFEALRNKYSHPSDDTLWRAIDEVYQYHITAYRLYNGV